MVFFEFENHEFFRACLDLRKMNAGGSVCRGMMTVHVFG